MRWWSGPRVRIEDGVTFHAISPLLRMYTKNGHRSIIQGVIFALFCLRLMTCRFDVLDVDQIPYFHLFPLRLIATIRRKPLIATWHEVWGPLAWRQYLKWLGWLGWWVEAAAIRMPDHIIAVSAQTSARLHEFLDEGASVVTIPNGIDMAAIGEVPASPHQVDIVTVGRLIEHKRVHMLLDVISSLHSRGMHVTCRIIGDGPDRLALQRYAKALGIDSAVEFCHDIAEQKELYSLIKASRLFISLSTREGFGIAVLEAITCGIPVLTTTAPDNLAQYLAMRYSLGSVCGEQVAEIVDAAAGILAREDSSHSLSTDGWVEEYGWEATVQRIANIYRSGSVASEVQMPVAAGELVLDTTLVAGHLTRTLAGRLAALGDQLAVPVPAQVIGERPNRIVLVHPEKFLNDYGGPVGRATIDPLLPGSCR